MRRRFGRVRQIQFLIVVLAFFGAASGASAGGGHYVFDGGTARQRDEVVAALQTSSFDWDIVAPTVTIHIGRGIDSAAAPGVIWLDADLLDAGDFSWGVVQHEYAHEVDFFVLTDKTRAELSQLIGGRAWYETDEPGLAHSSYGCERFASTLAYAYWPSPRNSMSPQSAHDESAALPAGAFRAALASVLVAAGTAGGPLSQSDRPELTLRLP